MENLTIIVPLYKYNEQVEKYLTEAFKSVKKLEESEKCKVKIIGPQETIEKAEQIFNSLKCPQALSLVANEETDFFTQINKAAFSCTTKYFSILEFDDEFRPTWFKNVDKYIKSGNNVSVFIPLCKSREENGAEIGFINEITWATGFSDEMGVINGESLEVFMDYNLTGSVFKTEDFITIGGLKKSLKVAAWYEFLLRACYNNLKLFVIPRIGYLHTVGRKDSYMVNSKDEISNEEGSWLLTTAKQEYFFKEDRNKAFNNEGE